MAIGKGVSFISCMVPPRALGCAHALRPGRSSHMLERQTQAARLHLLLRQQAKHGGGNMGGTQCRFQSNSHTPNEDTTTSQGPKPGSRPKITRPTFREIMRAALNFKILTSIFRPRMLKKLYRQNPVELVIALTTVPFAIGLWLYTFHTYINYYYHEKFMRYPPDVAKALRRALYYCNFSPDAKLALKYYKIALERCDENKLDPFSDDVLGIKIQLAAWLESVGNFDNAARVLETLLSECRRWVSVMEASVRDGTTKDPKAEPPAGQDVVHATLEPGRETLWGKRTRLLGKAVGISIKLGSLYASEYVRKPERAHERLLWGVETVLQELVRRSREGLKDGEGEWMTPDAIGAALESLGHSYEANSQFDLAIPLFFQALQLSRDPCHQAVLMNNLAVSYAQHPIRPTADPQLIALVLGEETKPSTSASPKETRASYLAAAERWARDAHKQATAGPAPKTSGGPKGSPAECDEACAVSLCNLGDIAQLSGDAAAARHWFQQAAQFSEKIGFAPGLAQAEQGLSALAAPAGSSSQKGHGVGGGEA